MSKKNQKSGEGKDPQLPCLIWDEKTPKSQNTGELPGNYQGIPRLPIFEIKKTSPLRGVYSLAPNTMTTLSVEIRTSCYFPRLKVRE